VTDPFHLDRGRTRRAFDRAAPGYDAAAVLQSRVREELLGRLDVVRIEPAVVLDLGAGTGHASIALKRRYRTAQVVALDLSPAMLAEAARRQTLLRRFRRVCADAAALPLGTASVLASWRIRTIAISGWAMARSRADVGAMLSGVGSAPASRV